MQAQAFPDCEAGPFISIGAPMEFILRPGWAVTTPTYHIHDRATALRLAAELLAAADELWPEVEQAEEATDA